MAIDEIRGYKSTRLGQRHRAEPVIESRDPRNKKIFWVGPPGKEQDAGEGTDFYAVANNFVSITPLKIDLTNHDLLNDLSEWLEGFQ